MIRKRRTAAVVAVAAALTLAAGCGRDSGGGEEQQAQSVAEGKASGEITVWAMGTEGEKLGAFAQAFTAENPDAKVTVTAIPWDAAQQKIAGAIAAKQTPDVSMIGTTLQGEVAKTGALDPTPTDLFTKDAYFPGAWDGTVVDGTSYGVPWYVETRVIYYRTDLAQKAGITAPPKTWDELTAMAKAMQDKGGAKWGINLQPSKTGTWQSMLPFAWSNGAEIADGTNWTFDSPQMVEAFGYYQSFFTQKLAPPDLPQGQMEPDFIAGRIGAFMSGPWHQGILNDLGGKEFASKYAVTPMPAKQSSTSFIGGSNIAVFKDAKNRDAAWKFIQWLSKPDVQAKWYQTVSDLPAVQAAWQDPALSGDKVLATFGEQLKSAKAPPAVPTWAQVAAVFDTEVEKMNIGGQAPDVTAKAIQQQAATIGTGS
jgi:multiple sugar transport system substrate-binding protein